MKPSRSASIAFAAALTLVASFSAAQTTPATRPAPASAEAFTQSLRAAKPGDVVLTSFAKLDGSIPPLPLLITASPYASKLVLSDRPEYFRTGDGIACQEAVPAGLVRFYVYHVPVMPDKKPRRVITLIENPGDAPATLTFYSHSEPTIGGDYNAIAKEAMTALLGRKGMGDQLIIPPHGHEVSDRSTPVADPDLLVHGLYDFMTDQPLRLTVAQVTASADLEADVAKIATLPKIPLVVRGTDPSGAGRGLFPVADFDVALAGATYDTQSGPSQLIVADGKTDTWIEGVDGISGDKTANKGNYGVIYRMKIKWKSTDGRGLAVLMTSARFDSKWCGNVAAAVKVNNGNQPGGIIPLPNNGVRFQGIPDACVIQTFTAPPNGREATIELDYTPPGACCLPTPILLVPIAK